MSFDSSKYESQIRAILEAPDVDLRTVSAKRVRKQLQEQNAELTKEFVGKYKNELNAAIHAVFEQIQGGADEEDDEDEDADEDGEPEVSTPVKRRRKDDGNGAPPKKSKTKAVSDEDLARQLQKELNGHRKARASSSAKTGRGGTKKGRKAKSSEVVNSDGESQDAEAKPKRKGGFTKEYVLSEPLAALLGVDKLSRPQAVKQIWEHIKAKNLQAPEDRRDIVCDDKMKAIFSVERINMFEMNKRLGEHLHTPPAPAA